MSRQKFLSKFILRWFVSALGLWVAAGLLNGNIAYDSSIGVIIFAGLILAMVNAVIKPIVILLSLPAILFSLGLFMIVINGFMVLIVSWLYDDLYVASFSAAVLGGIIIGIVNYLVSTILEDA